MLNISQNILKIVWCIKNDNINYSVKFQLSTVIFISKTDFA